jgi:catechol 2,3-dioxygenase-like lactoylglutathione lyase family enzyme
MAAELRDARPVLLVSDLEATLRYYRERLGFEVTAYGDPPGFGSATREGATVLFAPHADRDAIVPNWRIRDNTWNVYIEVRGVDALYEELIGRGAGIDYEIYDAPHGFREFGIQDPDGYDIAFGEPLS